MFVSTNDKRYCNKYNRDSQKGKIYLKFGMVNWATKQYDFWKPVKDMYWNIGWGLYEKGMLSISIAENGALPINWIKYIRWIKKNS